MPLVLLQYRAKGGLALKDLARILAQHLPEIVAPALTLSERKRHDGQVTPSDIIVRCVEGTKEDVNTKDLEIIIWAHDFPGRAANLEERKDAIINGVRQFLADHTEDELGFRLHVSGFVWILLQPTAFGQL